MHMGVWKAKNQLELKHKLFILYSLLKVAWTVDEKLEATPLRYISRPLIGSWLFKSNGDVTL